jgi:hypothetical protein
MLCAAKTVVRVRPFVREIEQLDKVYNIVEMRQREKAVVLTDPSVPSRISKSVGCDYCLDSFKPADEVGYASQDAVWQTIGLEVVADALDGFNSSVITYGQTGSGKSYTLFDDDGIVIKIVKEIKRRGIDADGDGFRLECSMVELYDENVFDLFSSQDTGTYMLSSLYFLLRI